MKKLGWFVFILFAIRTLFSFGSLLEWIGYEEVYMCLGDLTANVLLMIYLWNKVVKK